jgi:hypothetical protein
MKRLNWYWHTTVHKFWLFIELSKFGLGLIYRGIVHDLSKYGSFESKGYSETLPRLKSTTYGTEEYKALLDELKPVIDHHYQNNSHHPEHYVKGVSGMTLMDVVEMYLDWKISVRKHADGDLSKSLEINKERFDMSEDLTEIMRNTYYDDL